MLILFLTFSLMLLLLTSRFGLNGLLRLATLQLRGGILALLACLAQIVGMVTQQQQLMCLLVSAVLLARFCWFNRRQAGLVLAAVGITLNMTVMVLNGGTMPVSSAVVQQVLGTEAETARLIPLSKGTIVDDSAAPLHWLGDRLLLPGPLARIAAWSLGDVFLLAGVWWLLWQTMKGQHNDRHPFLRHAPS